MVAPEYKHLERDRSKGRLTDYEQSHLISVSTEMDYEANECMSEQLPL